MKLLLLATLLASPALALAQVSEPQVNPHVPQDTTLDEKRAEAERTQADADRNCVRYTGSHIKAPRNDRRSSDELEKVDGLDRRDCVSANGRVYSRSDLERTGAIDVADALRRLDPAIR